MSDQSPHAGQTPPTHQGTSDTNVEELRTYTRAAADAAPVLDASPPSERARMLSVIADAIDGDADRLIGLADEETSLGRPRLPGELARTTGQLRLFADVVEEGSFHGAIIDTPDPDATPPQPDIRRVLHGVGPVGVFSAGNFPFAFSVAGGDTASALAAGCPVIVKAHPGHPRLSLAVAALVDRAVNEVGAPAGSFACVFGVEVGRALVVDPAVKAVGFTGSVSGGRALYDLATGRPDPIPFYGELGSINPVVVTESSASRRGRQIAQGLVKSFTMGTGQFCTKPGVVLVPEGAGFVELVAAAVSPEPGPMLNERIAEGFHRGVAELGKSGRVEVVAGPPEQEGTTGTPVVFSTTVSRLQEDAEFLLQERFGPSCLLVRYRDDDELRTGLSLLPGSLTVSIHAEDDEMARARHWLRPFIERAGRVIWNGWPTGVAVTWSMQHGGPWPATTASLHTSVGATAVRRFLRPVAYQNWPDALLPPALQNANPLGLSRRVDGRMTTGRIGT